MRTYKVLDWGFKESLALYMYIYNEGALVPGIYICLKYFTFLTSNEMPKRATIGSPIIY